MRSYIIILYILFYGFTYSKDISEPIESRNQQTCLTDEIYGSLTKEEYNNKRNVILRVENTTTIESATSLAEHPNQVFCKGKTTGIVKKPF